MTQGRRGVTLILVALMIVVLVGMVGVVLDFSRFYAYRVQMQTTADAAALAGVQEIARNSPTTAPDTALHYVPPNIVDGGAAFMPRDSVLPGIWSFPARTFTAMPSTTPGVNAVQVSVNHTASYTFGRVWRTTDQNLRTTATAALGYVNTTSCLRPWTVSYQSLLDGLFPPAGSQPLSYDLTQADITALSAFGPADQITLLADTLGPTATGTIASVEVSAPWNGSSYRLGINGPCTNAQIGPGTSLTTDPFEPPGPPPAGRHTQNALYAFCNANGGTTGNVNNFQCVLPPKVLMAVWDNTTGAWPSVVYRVKYVAVFAVLGSVRLPAAPTGQAHISGYFTTSAGLGAVSATPSPILEGILVK